MQLCAPTATANFDRKMIMTIIILMIMTMVIFMILMIATMIMIIVTRTSRLAFSNSHTCRDKASAIFGASCRPRPTIVQSVERQPKPLFATRLELSQPDLVFQPSLEKEIVNNFYDTALSLVDDIMGMAGLIPRIAKSKEGANYIEAVRKHPELKQLREIYILRLEKVIGEAKEEANRYLHYSHLWTESRKEHLQCFLEFSRQVRKQRKI